MNTKHRLFWMGVSALGVGVWLTGCCTGRNPLANIKCVCPENEQEGYATIKCQPMDVEKVQGEEAKFKVDAKGKDIVYQWFVRAKPADCGTALADDATTKGSAAAELTILDVNSAKSGYYFCDIQTTGRWGAPVRTRTRDAHLGLTAVVGGTPSGGVQSYPPQQASMPAGVSGSSICGSHCGWLGFQNGGSGFDPDPGMTKGQAKVRIGTVFRSNTSFHLRWYDNLGNSGCAANSATDPNMKTFNINANRVYVFTVYFVSPCPAQGSQVFFELSFVP